MTTNDSGKKPVFKIEVSRSSIFIQALKPRRRAVTLAVLALLLILILVIAAARQDLQSKCFEMALTVIEGAIGILMAPGRSQ
jgi:hypothetical protein